MDLSRFAGYLYIADHMILQLRIVHLWNEETLLWKHVRFSMFRQSLPVCPPVETLLRKQNWFSWKQKLFLSDFRNIFCFPPSIFVLETLFLRLPTREKCCLMPTVWPYTLHFTPLLDVSYEIFRRFAMFGKHCRETVLPHLASARRTKTIRGLRWAVYIRN